MYIKTDFPDFISKEEIYYYMTEYNNGNLKAKDIIVESYIKLVFMIVKNQFKHSMFDKEDLISAGLEGLIKSVNTYDLSKNINFQHYAEKCIFNEILYFIRRSNKYLNIDSLNRSIQLNSSYGEFEYTVQDTLIDEKTDIENDYVKKMLIKEALEIIGNLPEREKKAICMFFGVCGHKKYTQIEIAQELNITQSGLSKLIKKILKNIKNIIDCTGEPIKKL